VRTVDREMVRAKGEGGLNLYTGKAARAASGPASGCRVQDVGFRVWRSGFRVGVFGVGA